MWLGITGQWVDMDEGDIGPDGFWRRREVTDEDIAARLRELTERVTDLGCCHDAGDCAEPLCGRAEPLCGRARPTGRAALLPEPINDSRNQDWD
jgi:hypothetical protein